MHQWTMVSDDRVTGIFGYQKRIPGIHHFPDWPSKLKYETSMGCAGSQVGALEFTGLFESTDCNCLAKWQNMELSVLV